MNIQKLSQLQLGVKPRANARNIVGPNMLWAFAHHVLCCCVLLRLLGSCWMKFEVKHPKTLESRGLRPRAFISFLTFLVFGKPRWNTRTRFWNITSKIILFTTWFEYLNGECLFLLPRFIKILLAVFTRLYCDSWRTNFIGSRATASNH